MTVEGANPSLPSFPGSETGTKLNIDANTPYSVDEEIPILDPDAELRDTIFSPGCSGQVPEGVTDTTCTILNLLGRK